MKLTTIIRCCRLINIHLLHVGNRFELLDHVSSFKLHTRTNLHSINKHVNMIKIRFFFTFFFLFSNRFRFV